MLPYAQPERRHHLRYSGIFFDLDGTLTDPTTGITKSVQYALAKMGIEAQPDALHGFIGPPLHHSFMTRHGFDEPRARQAIAYYREYFGAYGIYENEVLPGIRELLAALRAEGRLLCVVTSKPTVYAEQILQHFNLSAFFDAVVGSEFDLSNADKATLVALALNRYTGRPHTDLVMVGDREHDIIGASRNGIDSIGVTYGAGSHQEMTAANPTYIAESVSDVASLLGLGSIG